MAGSNLKWPVQLTAEEARITAPYNSTTGSIDFAAPKGTPVRAIATGKVYVVGGDWLQIVSEQFAVTYSSLQNVKVQAGQTINSGESIAESGADNIRLMVYQTFDSTALFEKPAAAPSAIRAQSVEADKPKVILLKSLAAGVRVREKPIDGKPQGQLAAGEVVESLESEASTQAKIGVQGEWINIKRFDGTLGYVTAGFMEIASGVPFVISGSLSGINLDINHPVGRPTPAELQGIGWVRIKFNLSYNPNNNSHGNIDVNATYNRYLPFIEQYARAGFKVLMVFTHQLYGEGAGFNWGDMNPDLWTRLINQYSEYARQVAEKFAGKNLVHAYQIWNEQDTIEGRAAVAVPPAIYGQMLTATIRALRKVDPTTPIITGGHTTGPDAGSQYALATLAAMPADVRPDGLAIHPYGRGVIGHKFSNFGALDEEIKKYTAVMPGKPVWITEWGVLNIQGNMSYINDACDYVDGFMKICKLQFTNQIACAIWYAWADSMDNGYGLVDDKGTPKTNLYNKFKSVG